MLQEIKNLPLLVHEKWLDHTTSSIVRKSTMKADQINRYFRTAGHPLDLTYHQSQLLSHLLGLYVSRKEPQVYLNPSVEKRVESCFHERLSEVTQGMGFREPFMVQLIYGPLDELAQAWITNYQDISMIGEDINRGPNDPYFKSKKVLEIQNIVNQTMEQSVRLMASIRDLEKTYHPLESQLTFIS